MQTAQEIRQLVPSALVDSLLMRFPDGREIPKRAVFDPVHAISSIPQDLDKRLARLAGLREQAALELERDLARYADFRTNGLSALSDYDILIAAQGDALYALRTALQLKVAHISWDLSCLDTIDTEITNAAEALESARPQLALF
jgi:hypothetical protein